MSNAVHCYLVEWDSFVEQATTNRAMAGIDWFWDAVADRASWIIRYKDLAPGWDDSGHRWTEQGLAYDDFREALPRDLQERFDVFFHTLMPSSEEETRRVELPAGVRWSATCFYAAVSPATVTRLAADAAELDFRALWPAFRDVLGEDDNPPPDAAEQLAACFADFRRYVTQWVGPLVASSQRGWGLVVA